MTAPGDRSGTVLGPYRLVRRVGRGGMGEVYEAVDTRKDRTVALKLLPENLAHDEDFRTRFLRESQTAAKLNDPHVIPIHDFGEVDGQLFLDMRIVEGQDLRGLIQRGPVPADKAVDIVGQIAGALDTAHAAGLTHRDVKPENILLDAKDFAYLVDFGLVQSAGQAGLTSTGMAIGSFNYMAPERFGNGQPVGPPSDIYALGCVLYETLTGAKPFGADSMEQIIAGHLQRALPSTGTPFDGVIARATAKDPAQRYASAGELAAAARAALAGRPEPAPAAVTAAAPIGSYEPTQYAQHGQYRQYPPPPPAAPQRSKTTLIVAAATVAVLAAAGISVWLWQSGDDTTATTTAISTAPAVTVTATTMPEATAVEATTSPASITSTARLPHDLGLSTPISSPDCDGSITAVFVAGVSDPAEYEEVIGTALRENNGASYMVTEGCTSLRQSSDVGGDLIYAVYYPSTSKDATCDKLQELGGATADRYARRLDMGTSPNTNLCP